MKAAVSTVLAMVMVFAVVAGIAIADDKDVTIKGTITCAKCDLKKEKACATVIVEKKGDKEVIYYFDTDSHKKNHKMVCTEAKKGSVTGDVAEKDGKMVITVKKVTFD
jgi:hypothetical protein